ncbi:MAG: NfeD family protein [Panacagrimonas sp.]
MELAALLKQMVYWHWMVLGLALLILEMLVPTNLVLLWMGISALIVGLVAWVLPTGWEAELILFGVLSVVSFFAYQRFRKIPAATDEPTLNRRGESYVGRTFTLATPIVNGVGKLRVDDSQWRVSGPDLPEGSQVRVVKADGATLKVERAP